MTEFRSSGYSSVALSSLVQLLVSNEPYFSSRERTWAHRLMQWINFFSPTVNLLEYMQYLKELALTYYRSELRFIFKLYSLLGRQSNPFIENYFLNLLPSQTTCHPNRLILSAEVHTALSHLTPDEQMALQFLALSGRRSIDILRLQPAPELSKPGSFYGRLPYDKCRSTIDLVEFHAHEGEFLSGEQFQTMERLLHTDFCQRINWNKIRRKTKIHLHKLRNRKTLWLLHNGFSEERIMRRLGWSSPSSLKRYSFLTPTVVSQFSSVDEVVIFSRSLCADSDDAGQLSE